MEVYREIQVTFGRGGFIYYLMNNGFKNHNYITNTDCKTDLIVNANGVNVTILIR